MAVKLCKMDTDTAEVDEPVNRPEQVILRDMILQRELVEQRRLRLLPLSHHRDLPPGKRSESAAEPSIKQEFSTK